MAVGGTEAIAGLQKKKYTYTGDDGVVYFITMRPEYAVENGMVEVGASGSPTVAGGKFPGNPRHVWLYAPVGSVTNHADKAIRRRMPYDIATGRQYLNGKAIGSLTAHAIDGITFEIEGHTGEKVRA